MRHKTRKGEFQRAFLATLIINLPGMAGMPSPPGNGLLPQWARIRRAASGTVESRLHLGSGAGGHDQFFKRAFQVTGVDLSPGMLALARATRIDGYYDQGLLGAGSYPITAYTGTFEP